VTAPDRPASTENPSNAAGRSIPATAQVGIYAELASRHGRREPGLQARESSTLMERGRHHSSRRLPNIFPGIGSAIRFTLFADFGDDEPVPSDVAWRAECTSIVTHGLAPVAHRLIHDRSIPAPDDVVKEFRNARFNDSAFTVTVVSRSRAGIDGLRAAGIPFAVTKGPGIASVCGTVSDRPFADLDVVVQPERFLAARDVLRRSGYTEQSRTIQPWDSFNRICREATNLRTRDGGSIDLHHRVSPWYWSSGLSFDYLASGLEETDVFGVRLPLVSTVDNLLVAALHVVSDRGRPGQTFRVWRDLLIP
jgi:hypothetical protein